jgi:hypothetical protein
MVRDRRTIGPSAGDSGAGCPIPCPRAGGRRGFPWIFAEDFEGPEGEACGRTGGKCWCARQDSNLRPLAPEATALSS